MSLLNYRFSKHWLRDPVKDEKIVVVGNGPGLLRSFDQNFEGIVAAADVASPRPTDPVTRLS